MEEEEEEELQEIPECPSQVRTRVLVCCNLGNQKKTDYAPALCCCCKCCWHVECIKPSVHGGALSKEDKAVLRRGSTAISGTWMCPRCCWLGAKFEAKGLRRASLQAKIYEGCHGSRPDLQDLRLDHQRRHGCHEQARGEVARGQEVGV